MAENFIVSADGNIKVSTLYSWTWATVAGTSLIARLDTFPNEAAVRTQKPDVIQLLLSPEQCREVGTVLLRMADELSQLPKNAVPQ